MTKKETLWTLFVELDATSLRLSNWNLAILKLGASKEQCREINNFLPASPTSWTATTEHSLVCWRTTTTYRLVQPVSSFTVEFAHRLIINVHRFFRNAFHSHFVLLERPSEVGLEVDGETSSITVLDDSEHAVTCTAVDVYPPNLVAAVLKYRNQDLNITESRRETVHSAVFSQPKFKFEGYINQLRQRLTCEVTLYGPETPATSRQSANVEVKGML